MYTFLMHFNLTKTSMLLQTIKLFVKDIKQYKRFTGLNVRNLSDECPCPCPCEETKKPTLVRQEAGLIRLGVIPNEWFEYFFKKTGVTGLGTFCFTVGTYIVSKEYYIMEHEYYNGLSMILLCALATKHVGPLLAKFIDKGIDEYEESLTSVREQNKKAIQETIDYENKLQESVEGQLLLIEAKRENVLLQREGAYRERCMQAYNETIKRLEFCAMREAIEKAFAKRSMADWIIAEVRDAITQEIEDASLDKCMEDLERLTETFETLEAPYPEETPETEKSDTTKPDSTEEK